MRRILMSALVVLLTASSAPAGAAEKCTCPLKLSKTQVATLASTDAPLRLSLEQDQLAIVKGAYPKLGSLATVNVPNPKQYADIDVMMCVDVNAKGELEALP